MVKTIQNPQQDSFVSDLKSIANEARRQAYRAADHLLVVRKLGVDMVDEHYYKSPEWFRSNASRYDEYDRKGPKVFAGEYAAHAKHDPNSWEAALSEAAFMTGLERNADVVYQATYAPLFAHVEGWQWRPDLIWFDNLSSVRSANYYVQQLYGENKGTNRSRSPFHQQMDQMNRRS